MIRTIAGILMSLALATPATSALSKTPIERVVTPKGIEIWLVRTMEFPMLSLQFSFLGGAAQDPAGKPGVASLAASLLDEGAGEYDARAFREQLEGNAIEISFNANRDSVRGSLKTLTDNQDKAFELLRLALTAPRFDASEIERVRSAILANLRRASTNPGEIAKNTWYARAFPNHPYGRPTAGTLDSVPNITVEDLRGYIAKNLARSNLKVAAVGAIDAATLAKLVDRAFDGLPEKADLMPVADIVPQSLGEREVIPLHVPQTVVLYGGVGLMRNDPDFIPAYVLNHILGGGSFDSRLFEEVRVKRGLSYSVSSTLAALKHAGLFIGSVQTKNDRAFESVDVINSEIERLAKDGPSAEELEKAKKYLIGSYPLRFDTSAKIATNLLDMQFEGLGLDYIERRNAMVAAVTAADVRRAANRFLAGAEMLTVMVGEPVAAPAKAANQ
ncbi:MAG TPA: pitrilysin family protein [Xanthobacteraceae bacterium]|nr:pitrilysin family protein [Xanthobacteraceae bacterium]